MKNKLTFLKFWIVAFSTVIYYVIRGKEWHWLSVDIEAEEGKRKRIQARRTAGGATLSCFHVPSWRDV